MWQGHCRTRKARGFTLIQLSILLTIASLTMVTLLPSGQQNVVTSSNSENRLNTVLTAVREFQAANGRIPCPANASQPINSTTYGVEAAGNGSTNNCTGGAPAANFVDSTNHVAIGMVPVRALQLPNDDALDNFGRDITYAVDTNATSCWSATALTGQVSVYDNGSTYNSIAAIVSHGADGHGAWLPLTGSSGTATRLNAGSTDTDQLVNAHLQSSGTFPNPTTSTYVANAEGSSTAFVNKTFTSTFDDMVVYSNPNWTLNNLPAVMTGSSVSLSPPANATYYSGQTLTFTLTFPSVMTVTGTPRLDLSALSSTSGNSIGTGNVAYATYVSGSGTTTLTFSYTVQPSDMALSGITVSSPIDTSAGLITPCFVFFTPPNLSGVLIIPPLIYVNGGDASGNSAIEVFNWMTGAYVTAFGDSGPHPLNQARNVTMDGSGNIWVLDDYTNVGIHEYNRAGSPISTISLSNHGGTSGSDNQVNAGYNMRIDSSGNFWIVDTLDYRLVKFNSSGTWQMSIGGAAGDQCAGTRASATTCNNLSGYTNCCKPNAAACNCTTGAANGQFSSGMSYGHGSLAIDGSGNIWVADNGNNRVQVFNGSTGAFIAGLGAGYNGVSGAIGSSGMGNGKLAGPGGIAFDASSPPNVYVANSTNYIDVFNSSTYAWEKSLVAQQWGSYADGRWEGDVPENLAIDASGNIWLTDLGSNRIQQLNPSGSWLTTSGGGSGCAGIRTSSTTCGTVNGYGACCAPNASSCSCTGGNGNGLFLSGIVYGVAIITGR